MTDRPKQQSLSREVRIILWIGIFAGVGFAIHLLNDVLLPFIVGMAIAYFFDPVVDRMEEWGMSRTLGTSLVLLGFFIVVFVILVLLLPLLREQIVGFVRLVPTVVDRVRDLMGPILTELRSDLSPDAFNEIKAAVANYAGTFARWATRVLTQVWSGGVAILNLLSLILITPLVSFYLLRDYDRIVVKIDGWLPRDAAPTIRKQAQLIDQTLAGFVRGQGLVCLTLAIFYAVALSLVGLNAGILIGLTAGTLAVIPFIGATLSFIVALGLAIAQFQQDWIPIALTAVVFITGQTIEGYFLTPKLVGDRVGLSPIWIIFAMLAGGSLFGLIGVLIALPVAAVAGVLVRFTLEQYMDSELYLGDDAPENRSSE
jgi:predicted PurR-regulated permease PerM